MQMVEQERDTIQSEAIGFEDYPMRTAHSHLLGEINLYAPNTPPSTWSEMPWKLTTKWGYEGMDSEGLVYIIKPEHIHHCFHHIALVESKHLWPSI